MNLELQLSNNNILKNNGIDCNAQNINKSNKNAVKTEFTMLLQPKKNEIAIESIDNCNEKTAKKVTIAEREFTDLDIQYWQNLGVDISLLKKYNCSSVFSYSWDNINNFKTKIQAVAFAWELNGNIKLYIPNQPDINVKKNVLPPFKSGIFGLEQLGAEKKENIIIFEGEKDVIVSTSRGFN